MFPLLLYNTPMILNIFFGSAKVDHLNLAPNPCFTCCWHGQPQQPRRTSEFNMAHSISAVRTRSIFRTHTKKVESKDWLLRKSIHPTKTPSKRCFATNTRWSLEVGWEKKLSSTQPAQSPTLNSETSQVAEKHLPKASTTLPFLVKGGTGW